MDFIEKWIRVFCKDCDKDKVNEHVREQGNLIWHTFSWELVAKEKYLEGEQARKEFDGISKKNAEFYVFYPEEERFVQDVKDSMDSIFFDKFIEVYVVAKDYSWTYIKTHEDYFGPYFYKVK